MNENTNSINQPQKKHTSLKVIGGGIIGFFIFKRVLAFITVLFDEGIFNSYFLKHINQFSDALKHMNLKNIYNMYDYKDDRFQFYISIIIAFLIGFTLMKMILKWDKMDKILEFFEKKRKYFKRILYIVFILWVIIRFIQVKL